MAAKKTASKGDKPMSKTAFIRNLGPDVPPGEVIAKAKEQGLELAKKLVYTTQSEMRTGGKRAGKKGKAAKVKKVAATNVRLDASTPASAAPVAAKPKKGKKPGPKAGFRKKAAKAAAAPAKASNGSTAEQKLKALVIELGTARADEVYRAVKGQLNAILGA